MKKSKFIENKVLLLFVVIIVICFCLILYALFKYFYLGASNSVYGDRLNNIESYKLDNNLEKDIKSLYSNNSNVGEINLNVKGKIVYITFDFVKAIKLEDAKSLVLKVLDKFSTEEKSFYDIQFILTAESLEGNKTFPTMGYKNASSTVVVWLNK